MAHKVKRLSTALAMIGIISIATQGCMETPSQPVFNAKGKVRRVNHVDSSITVDTTRGKSPQIKTVLVISPVNTDSMRVGDSAHFKLGQQLANGTKSVDTISIIPKQRKSKNKKKTIARL